MDFEALFEFFQFIPSQYFLSEDAHGHKKGYEIRRSCFLLEEKES